jgi:hypothetical protein
LWPDLGFEMDILLRREGYLCALQQRHKSVASRTVGLCCMSKRTATRWKVVAGYAARKVAEPVQCRDRTARNFAGPLATAASTGKCMTGPRNLISDIAGVRVGNAHDERLGSGVTVLLADNRLIAAVDVRGGGPGTRETDAVSLAGMVDEVHAIVLSGGSAFGLSAATGVQSWLAERGVGFAIRSARVPLVPQAVLFDLLNGGNKAWGSSPPYEGLGRMACEAASANFAIGSAGAGFGATTARTRGGLGSASQVLDHGLNGGGPGSGQSGRQPHDRGYAPLLGRTVRGG